MSHSNAYGMLTEAQIDGRACLWCGREDGRMVPVLGGPMVPGTGPLFGHEGCRPAELDDWLSDEQRSVLAFLDGVLMEKANNESAERQAESFSFARMRTRLHAAFPFLKRIPDAS